MAVNTLAARLSSPAQGRTRQASQRGALHDCRTPRPVAIPSQIKLVRKLMECDRKMPEAFFPAGAPLLKSCIAAL
jgi:hypothetical protein